jgi:hypothetical protein
VLSLLPMYTFVDMQTGNESAWNSVFSWVSQTSTVPPILFAVLLLAVGAALAAYPVSWEKTRLFATWVHEASHALAAWVTGRRVTGMKVNADTSGTTSHVGREKGLGRILTAFAGYPGPAFLGVAICFAVANGRASYAIVGLLLLSLLLLPFQRSLRGLGVTLLVGVAVAFIVAWQDDSAFVGWGLLVVAGYLFMASPRTIVELHRVRRGRKKQENSGDDAEHSDADALAHLTHLPAVLWECVFMVVSVAAVGVSLDAIVFNG